MDFSPVTDRVIETAVGLPRAVHGGITLLHVARPEPDFIGYEAGPQSVRDRVAAEFRGQRHTLQDLANRIRAAGISVSEGVIRRSPVPVLVVPPAHS